MYQKWLVLAEYTSSPRGVGSLRRCRRACFGGYGFKLGVSEGAALLLFIIVSLSRRRSPLFVAFLFFHYL